MAKKLILTASALTLSDLAESQPAKLADMYVDRCKSHASAFTDMGKIVHSLNGKKLQKGETAQTYLLKREVPKGSISNAQKAAFVVSELVETGLITEEVYDTRITFRSAVAVKKLLAGDCEAEVSPERVAELFNDDKIKRPALTRELTCLAEHGMTTAEKEEADREAAAERKRLEHEAARAAEADKKFEEEEAKRIAAEAEAAKAQAEADAANEKLAESEEEEEVSADDDTPEEIESEEEEEVPADDDTPEEIESETEEEEEEVTAEDDAPAATPTPEKSPVFSVVGGGESEDDPEDLLAEVLEKISGLETDIFQLEDTEQIAAIEALEATLKTLQESALAAAS